MPGVRWIALAGAWLMIGAGCALPSLGKNAQTNAPIRCEYNGKAYDLGEQRSAEDGCNICTCGETGWQCTTLRCAAGPSAGTVRGTLLFPSEKKTALQVCAIPREGAEYCTQTGAGQTDYRFRVPEGLYVVYASDPEDESGGKAYWSEAVKCGLKAECKDHSPIEIEVKAGGETSADPQDWHASTTIETVAVTPSRRLDNAFFLKRGAGITIRGKNLAEVSLDYKTYPPGENMTTKAIGKASLQTTDNGIQKWTINVPVGFEATDVLINGSGENGDTFRWRPLGTFRWGDLPPTEEELQAMTP